jgi:CBS domain containing-hemolysin-like protein
MFSYLLALLFLVLALAGVIVRKIYYRIPVRELKRRAARHDAVAEQLYRAVSYGNSTKTLLWLYIGLVSAASVVLLARNLPVWASLLIVGPVLWIVFSYVPASRVTSIGTRLAMIATPIIAGTLNYLHPLLNRAGDAVEGKYIAASHTQLFEREDLLDLLERQAQQPDNRFTTEELEIAKRALQFEDYPVSEILTPRKKTASVLADDPIGPILIDELHKTGQKYILVRESKKGPLVGILDVSSLGLKSSGKVKDLMHPTVYYVHEDDDLGEALHAFFVTNFPLFVVVNSFEEFTGIVSVENILQQLLGHVPGSDFDQYADIKAVAKRHQPERKSEPADKTDETV